MQVDISTLCQELRERRAETNTNRKMLPVIRDLLRESATQRILQPPAYGGLGGPLSEIVDVLDANQRGVRLWRLVRRAVRHAQSHDRAMADRGPRRRMGTGSESLGQWHLDPQLCRWPWVTGVDSCDWCMVVAYEQDKPGPDTHRHFLLHRPQIDVIDTWHAIGLRGSGTNDIRIEQLFIPHHLSLPLADLRGGESPGGHGCDHALYRLPAYATFGIAITSGTVGISREITAQYNAIVRKKTSVMSEQSVMDFSSQQIKFAEAQCAADSAAELLRFAADEFQAIASEGGRLPTDVERARCRALATFAGKTAMDAAKLVWDLSGANSVLSANPLAGLYTDVIVARQHFTQNTDPNFKSYGRALYGLPLDNLTL